MVGESQRVPVSDPDPSVYVQAAIDRAAAHHKELVDAQIGIVMAEIRVLVQRLNDMDEANKILSENVNRTPTIVQTEIGHVRELMDKDRDAINQRFSERDARYAVRDIDQAASISAAFEAAKALSQQQEASNKLAIDKAEKATNDTINKNADLTNKSIQALTERVDEVKDRVGAIESEERGGRQKSVDYRAVIVVAIGVLTLLVGIAAIIISAVVSSNGG